MVWRKADCPVRTFEEVGLQGASPDAVVWHLCQERDIVLITGNRNQEGPDSLEATIRTSNTRTSLPVVTIADPKRVMRSKEYAEKAIARLLEYLLDIDNYRGTGRLYIP